MAERIWRREVRLFFSLLIYSCLEREIEEGDEMMAMKDMLIRYRAPVLLLPFPVRAAS